MIVCKKFILLLLCQIVRILVIHEFWHDLMAVLGNLDFKDKSSQASCPTASMIMW